MEKTKIFRLRMELRDSRGMSLAKNRDLKLAGAKNGIIREVLVSGDMMLSDLHFLIQRLFGWKNLHLHRFALRESDFSWVTDGDPETLAELIGALFKAVDDTGFEWDWHRRYGGAPLPKDEGEKRRFSIEESFILNHMKASSPSGSVKKRLRSLRLCPDPTAAGNMKEGYNILLDRLRLSEIFSLRERSLQAVSLARERESWRNGMRASTEECLRRIDSMSREQSKEYRQAMSALRRYQTLKSDYMALLELRAAPLPGESIETRKNLNDIIGEHEEKLEEYAIEATPLTQRMSPCIAPMFSGINYWYDRGDEWCIGITCINIFIKKGEEEAFEILGPGKAERRIIEGVERVCSTHAPVCVHSEGYDLVDNIGGVDGYFRMLKAFEEPEMEEARLLREMAAIYGWERHNL